ncbi:MAG: DMT family transporter [Patescibacteria group bacterium]
MNHHYIGGALTLVGALLAAKFAVKQRKLLKRSENEAECPAEDVALSATMCVATLALFAVFFLSGAPANIKPGFWLWVLITGILNVFISYLGFKALATKDDVSLIVPIRDTTPAFVVFTAWFVTRYFGGAGEAPSLLGYVGILLLVLGTYVLNIQGLIDALYGGQWTWRAFLDPWVGLWKRPGVRLAFLASCIGCIAISFDGLAARAGNPILAVACVVSFPAVIHASRVIASGRAHEWFDRKRGMPWGGVKLGLLFALAVALYWISFLYLFVAYQATLKRMETVFVLLFAYRELDERKEIRTRLVAVALMIMGAVLVARQ